MRKAFLNMLIQLTLECVGTEQTIIDVCYAQHTTTEIYG